MPMRLIAAGLVLAISFLGSGCSTSSKWAVFHPNYSAWPPAESPEILGPADRWVVLRGTWMAKHLSLAPEQVYDSLGSWISQSLNNAFQSTWPSAQHLPKDLYAAFAPAESARLDKKRFAKIRLPAQGQTLKAGRWILIVHEIILGPDVRRETFFDAEFTNQTQASPTRNGASVGMLALWTLWDNDRQAARVTAISEAQIAAGQMSRATIQQLTQTLIADIQCTMERRCSR